ncbi:MAG TPA: hypothetical protein VMT73_11885, partial [Anaerolineales bacterium]|nr:hypothetical protein [Anaerolineales bacterium]
RERAAKSIKDFDPNDSLLLIFDQFEEVVRVSAVDRSVKFDFFSQLGDLLRDRDLWALFAIREDYLAAIEPYNRPIPTRFSVTYHLDFLDARSAIDAIQQPAKESGVMFEDTAAAKLVDDLRRIRVQQADGTAVDQLGPYVEPVQLQVVCRRLWNKAAGKGTVTSEDVSQAGNIDDALSDYYAFQVSSAAADSSVSERQIREWFDRKLITVRGIRGQVLMEPNASGGLPNTTIKLLQEAYLVRADKRGNAVWFELAHDRLTRPVRHNNAEWFSANLNVFQRQADLWNTQGRPDALLLTGTAYLQAETWVKQHSDDLLPVEKEFFDACGEEHRRAVREHRTNILIRWAAVLMTLLAIAAMVFFVQAQQAAQFARQQEAVAKQNADLASQQKELAYQKEQLANLNVEIAQIRALAAQAINNLTVDPELSIRLALQAIQGVDVTQPEMHDAVQQVEDALRQALPAMRVEQVLKDPSLSASDIFTHSGTVWSSSFSVDGQRLATAGNDGTLKIWDVLTGKLLQTIDVLTPASGGYGVTFTAFSPDGNLLAASTGDGRIFLYNAATYAPIKSFQAHQGVIWGLAFSPDSSRLASGGDDSVIHIWDLQTYQSTLDLVGHTDAIQSLAFSPDGVRIASASLDGSAIVWDAFSGRIIYRLIGHNGFVNGVAFSPDGKKLATSGEDRTIILWDLSNGQKIMTITGHSDWVYAIAFTKDGSNLISVSADRTIRFWDTTYGRPGLVLYGHKDQVFGLALSPDGMRIATTSKDRTARIWNVSPQGSRELLTIDNRASIYKIAVNPSGSLLATAGGDDNVRIWNPSTAQLIQTLTGHTGIVEGIAFSPDGTKLATASRDQTAKIWDVTTGQELLTFDQHKGRIWDIAFSPDGKRVATASEDGTVKIWDPTTGDVYQDLPAQSDWKDAQCLAFSPDGSILAVGYYGSQIVLWDPSTGKQLKVLTGHTDIVETLAFRPDGQVLASGGDDGSIILWDMNRANWGQSQAPMIGRGDTVFDLAFSPDGKYLYSGGADGIGTLWNLEDRQPEFETYGHTDRIYSVAFNPNGKVLYSGGRDGTLRMYVFSFDELVQLANKRTTREFSEDECRQYLNEACPTNITQTGQAVMTANLKLPGTVPASADSQTNDADSSVTASELRANGGDDFTYGTFERPFNGGQMNVYYPDIDITHAQLSEDKQWGYVTIRLAGLRGGSLLGNYGIEFDLDVNGRGDLLITTLAPGTDWSTNGVRIWQDKNGDVGNNVPYISDPPQTGDGYETLLFDQGNGDLPDLAWSRIDPNDPKSVQIAFQLKVINNDPVFAWTAWASRDSFKPAWFDYNDHFTAAEAGSPLKGDSLYPLKALAGVDNTCRMPFGFQTPGQRGFCQNEP